MIDELLDMLQPVIVLACVIAFSYIAYGYITLTIDKDAKPCQTIIILVHVSWTTVNGQTNQKNLGGWLLF